MITVAQRYHQQQMFVYIFNCSNKRNAKFYTVLVNKCVLSQLFSLVGHFWIIIFWTSGIFSELSNFWKLFLPTYVLFLQVNLICLNPGSCTNRPTNRLDRTTNVVSYYVCLGKYITSVEVFLCHCNYGTFLNRFWAISCPFWHFGVNFGN